MAHRPVTLQLVRDGQCTPWGFRMSGGADIGTPLMIQRVTMGSPSEGELQKGDIILFVGDQDARKMSHYRASEIIAKTGNIIKLVVARIPGPPPPMSPTISPTPNAPLQMYRNLKSNHGGNPDLFKPLPKTEFQNDVGRTTNNDNIYSTYNPEEKVAIANQAYRTLPLITPSLKTTKDYPTGSYLRHNADTSGRTSSATNIGNKVNDAYMITRVQEAVLEKALSSPRASASSSRTPTPDSGYQSVYLRQYNSPINIYSTQNVLETLNEQTAAHKHTATHAATHPQSTTQKQKLNSPIVQTPLPTPGIPDLSKSPTYQLVHEQDKMKECDPVKNRLYNIEEQMAAGSYTDIPQSESFKTVMSNVKQIKT